VNFLASRLLRRLCLLVILFCVGYLAMQGIRHTPWFKQRLFTRLLTGEYQQQLHAAVTLAQLGAQEQLLAGLKAESATARELARRSLEFLWFNAAGDEAYQLLQAAYQTAEQGAHEAALAILDRLVEKFPRFAEGWNRRAAVLWELGRHAESLADCERALALNPNHYGAWQGIGICRLQQGDVSEACRCLRAALQIAPHDEATRQSLQQCEELLRVYPHPDQGRKEADLL
jgi:tetratricopeptide (TPR) repeat protein